MVQRQRHAKSISRRELHYLSTVLRVVQHAVMRQCHSLWVASSATGELYVNNIFKCYLRLSFFEVLSIISLNFKEILPVYQPINFSVREHNHIFEGRDF